MRARHLSICDCRIYGFATSMYEGCGPTRAEPCSEGVAEGAIVESEVREGGDGTTSLKQSSGPRWGGNVFGEPPMIQKLVSMWSQRCRA